MPKLTSPLGSELWITQTYHTGGNNTAIDLSIPNLSANTPIYAIASGKVLKVSTSSGSYICTTCDGADFNIFYVHINRFQVKVGQEIKKGQLIGYIAPKSVNGGYPMHLHLGLTVGYHIMDYLDRSIIFRTKYQEIKDIWFKGEDLDWSKFRDLSYMSFKIGDKIVITGEQNIRQGSGTSYPITGNTETGEIYEIEDGPRTSDGYTWYDLKNNNWVADVGKFKLFIEEEIPIDCQKEIDRLLEVNRGLSEALGASEAQVKERDKSLGEANERIRILEAEKEESKKDYLKLEDDYKRVFEDRNRIEQEKLMVQEELDRLKQSSNWSKRLSEFVKDILERLFTKG